MGIALPHLGFYAVDDDRRAVVDAVFDLGGFAVFEMYSQPGRPIRHFERACDVPMVPHGPHLMLHAAGVGGIPILDDPADTEVSVPIGGWGLIQLSFGGFFARRELRWSVTNHNTLKRAEKWHGVHPELGSPHGWDWSAISRASARLNRRIRALAVDEIGPKPVLPAAADLVARHGLRHVYGTGVHARPVG